MKIVREPLVQFLILGAALFGLFHYLGEEPNRIVITPKMIESFNLTFQRNNNRPPTATEFEALVEDYIREEIFNHEARELGLDRDDPIVRKRLRQRMEFLLEEDANAQPPGDAELQRFLEERADKFRAADGAVKGLAEVRDAVLRAWQEAQRAKAIDAAYEQMRPKYQVVRQDRTEATAKSAPSPAPVASPSPSP